MNKINIVEVVFSLYGSINLDNFSEGIWSVIVSSGSFLAQRIFLFVPFLLIFFLLTVFLIFIQTIISVFLFFLLIWRINFLVVWRFFFRREFINQISL